MTAIDREKLRAVINEEADIRLPDGSLAIGRAHLLAIIDNDVRLAAPALPADLENAKADAFQSGYNKGFNDGGLVESNRAALPAGPPDVETLAHALHFDRVLSRGGCEAYPAAMEQGWCDNCIFIAAAILAALEGSATPEETPELSCLGCGLVREPSTWDAQSHAYLCVECVGAIRWRKDEALVADTLSRIFTACVIPAYDHWDDPLLYASPGPGWDSTKSLFPATVKAIEHPSVPSDWMRDRVHSFCEIALSGSATLPSDRGRTE